MKHKLLIVFLMISISGFVCGMESPKSDDSHSRALFSGPKTIAFDPMCNAMQSSSFYYSRVDTTKRAEGVNHKPFSALSDRASKAGGRGLASFLHVSANGVSGLVSPSVSPTSPELIGSSIEEIA